MGNFLVIYLLVFSTFFPYAVGFGDTAYYTFTDLDDVAIKVYQIIKSEALYKDLVDRGDYFKLYKITLSAEDFIQGKGVACVIRTETYFKIEEIPLPKYEIEGAKYIYLYKNPLTKGVK